MNNLLEDKKNLVLLGIILFLLLALLYFYWVKPVKDEVAASKQEVERLEQTIDQLTAEIAAEEKKTEVDGDSYQLIKKLPLSRQVDEFLLSLLEIEIVSQSQIESIAFNNYEGELSDSDRIDGGESESEVAEQEETADEEVHLDKASEDDTADLEEPGNPPGFRCGRSITGKCSVNHFTTGCHLTEFRTVPEIFKGTGKTRTPGTC